MRVQLIFGRWIVNDWDEFTAVNAAALVDFLNRKQRSTKLGLFDDRHRTSAREQNADAPWLPSRSAPRNSHHRAAPPRSANCNGIFLPRKINATLHLRASQRFCRTTSRGWKFEAAV